jgi:hypothetical protein
MPIKKELHKKEIIIICVIIICVITIAMLFFRNTNTSNVITVKEKYVKQSFEPKKNKPQLPKGAAVCGLTLYDIVVKYYVTDTSNTIYELTINDYEKVKEGSKIQVTTAKNNVIKNIKILTY